MTFKATGFHDALDYKIVHESGATNSDYQNVTTSPGTLHSCLAVNSTGTVGYIKIFDSPNAVGGTTQPILVFRIAASATELYEIPGGLSFTNLSFTATLNQRPLDDTSPAATIDVKLVCS